MTSKGGPSHPHAAQVGHQGGAVGPPLGAALLGQAGPRPLAHHAAEEALRLLAGIVRQRRPRDPSLAAEAQPGHGWLEGPDGVEGPGDGERGTDHDVAPEAVPDGHHRATAGLGARRLRHGQQIVDVPPEVHDPAVPGALVAPPVVGQRGELGQPAHDQPEAVAPVERSVDEDDRARTGCRGPAAW